jgi:hypothetical protein
MEESNSMSSIYEHIVEQIMGIETEGLRDNVNQVPSSEIIEDQKVYFWIRLYTKEEISDLQEGDDINISYRGEETLPVKFITFGKKNINKDSVDEIVGYDPEDDRKCLCLMVDEERVKKNSGDIPFIRTLFKTSPYYEFQLYKRNELTFTNTRTEDNYTYIDVDF